MNYDNPTRINLVFDNGFIISKITTTQPPYITTKNHVQKAQQPTRKPVISMDPLYRRRIPTGHVQFDELYIKIFGDIPEEQNSRISQNELFESLYQKYYNDNAEDISRQRIFDDLYVKYADELQVFGGGDESIDFVYTLVDNSSNVSDTSKLELISSPQTKSSITSTSLSYQKINSQKGYNDMSKINSQEVDFLIPPPITNPPQKEVSISLTSPENKDKSNSSLSSKSPIKQVPKKIQTRRSTRLNSSSSPKIPKINNTQSSRSDSDTKCNTDDSLIAPTNKSGNSEKKLQTSIKTKRTKKVKMV